MQAAFRSPHLFRRAVLALAFVVVASWGAGAAAVGGGFWPAVGPGRIALKRSGIKPLGILANFRFDFSGASSDSSGSAVISAYDAIGQSLLAEFPATWTTGKGAAFQMDLANDGFRDFLEGRIAAATGKSVSLTLESVKCKGNVAKAGTDLRASVVASGEATLDEGPPLRFTAKMRLK